MVSGNDPIFLALLCSFAGNCSASRHVARPVFTVVADLNRYSLRRIELDGASLRDISISASFNLDQQDEMIDGLAAGLSLEKVDEEERMVLRRRR